MSYNVLITGANRGIGLEFVRQYAADQWQVFACCRAPESAAELSQLAADYPAKVHIIPLDLSNAAALTNIKSQLANEKVDLFVNNAGIYGPRARLGDIDANAWQQVFTVNTIAPLKMVELLLHNLDAGEKKSIALLTSKMGSIADNSSGGSYFYRSSKAALNALGKSLAIDLAPQGIKLGIYHPGWVKTDMGGANALISTGESVSALRQQIEQLTLENSGQFKNYDGSIIPW